MPRAARRFRLLHAIRMLPQPVTAARLAEETGVSSRTLYRDMDALRAGGALIDGAAGVGDTLTEDPALPPQMFTRLEVAALVPGLAEVRLAGDPELARAAQAALAKITATLPEPVQRQAIHAVQQSYRFERRPQAAAALALLRQAGWDECAVDLTDADRDGTITERRIWPLSVICLDRTLLLAFCCLRQDFRRFHRSQMADIRRSDASLRPRRVPLLRDFRRQMRAFQPPVAPLPSASPTTNSTA